MNVLVMIVRGKIELIGQVLDEMQCCNLKMYILRKRVQKLKNVPHLMASFQDFAYKVEIGRATVVKSILETKNVNVKC